jgi:hypothetical protein
MYSFFEGEYDEERFKEEVIAMFALEKAPSGDGVLDVKYFAEYAIPRLVVGSVYSPESIRAHYAYDHDYLYAPENSSTRVFGHVQEGLLGHDLFHATAAYVLSGGQSLVPEYTKQESNQAARSNLACIQEEIFAMVWDGKFPYDVLRLADTDLSFKTRFASYFKDSVEETRKEFSEFPNITENTFETFLSAWEYFSLAKINREKINDLIPQLSANRSPKYVAVMRNIFENSQSKNPDPNILLHEWQRVLLPLLERLRRKGEIAA